MLERILIAFKKFNFYFAPKTSMGHISSKLILVAIKGHYFRGQVFIGSFQVNLRSFKLILKTGILKDYPFNLSK